MTETKTTEAKHKTIDKEEKSDWKETALGMIKTFFENFFVQLTGHLKQKAEMFIIKLKNSLISLVLVLLGLIFFAIGVAVMLDYLIGVPGLGYLIIGMLMLMFGIIVKMKKA